jgi:2-phosphosulfolactate phosphatase
MPVAAALLRFHRTSVSGVSVHVAFVPGEGATAEVGIVVDVVRATSSIVQALAAGYERVLCCREIAEAVALREELGDEAVVGGERDGTKVEGFDVGASPREFARGARAKTLILSTTNGTAAILGAAARCRTVLLGSLLNLAALATATRSLGGDVDIVCAGFKGAFALDDAYCAGRIVAELDGERSDAARAAELVALSFPGALEGLNARTYGPPGLEQDIAFCARESVLDTVPRFTRMVGSAAEIVA